jgi:hypothetical protein
MTCPNAGKWDLLSMTLLTPMESTSLLAHAHGCERCRAALGHARRDHAALLRAFEVFDQDHDVLREQLLATLPAALPQRTDPFAGRRVRRGLGGFIMSLHAAHRKLAAVLVPAACLLFAVVLVLYWPGRGAVAFAQVLEHMRLAKTMVCDYGSVSTVTIDGSTQEHRSRGKLSMYSDDATRAWRIDLVEPSSTQLNLPDRMIVTNEDGKREVFKLGDRNDSAHLPQQDAWLRRLFELTEDADRALGDDVVDGRIVAGFEIAGWKLGVGVRPTPGDTSSGSQSAVLRLWVDKETRLPVRLQIDEESPTVASGRTETSTTWEHIQWNIPVNPELFQAPPETAADKITQLDVPAPTEESLIQGLRAYLAQSERIEKLLAARAAQVQNDPGELKALEQARQALLATSAYPMQLDMAWLTNAVTRESGLHAAERIRARQRGDSAAVQRATEEGERAAQEISQALMPVGLFYQNLLMERRDPEYFGATVRPGDGKAVLLRWKLDNALQRVVYGDLRVETVPAN